MRTLRNFPDWKKVGLNNPLVSVIIPVFNAEKTIASTISSALFQTYDNFEIILVNDKSTDNTLNILKDTSDKRLKIINLRKNSGAAKARNVGIKVAKGRFIAFLDSDDLWSSDKLEVQTRFMLNNGYAFTYTGYKFSDKDGNTKKVVKIPEKISYKQALKNTTIFTSTVMLDMKKLKKKNVLMPDVRRGQDTATWWKILKDVDFAYGINWPFSIYRRSNNTLSSNKIKALKRTWFLYRNVEKLGLSSSTYNFCWYLFNAIKRRV